MSDSASKYVNNLGGRPGTSAPKRVAPVQAEIIDSLDLGPIVWIDPAVLVPDPENNIFDQDKLEDESYSTRLEQDILENGIHTPLLVSGATKMILAGHTRLKIALAHPDKFPTVPVRYFTKNLSDDERRKFLIRDNVSRFQISKDRLLVLAVKCYPGFHLSNAPKEVVQQAKDMLGVADRQFVNLQNTVSDAARIMEALGTNNIEEAIETAVRLRNEQRKIEEKAKKISEVAKPKVKEDKPHPDDVVKDLLHKIIERFKNPSPENQIEGLSELKTLVVVLSKFNMITPATKKLMDDLF